MCCYCHRGLMILWVVLLVSGLYPLGNFGLADAEALPSVDPASITTNASDYPNSVIPKYEKFEITFDMTNILATNLQLPYVQSDPGTYLENFSEKGISVDGLFLPPGQSDWNQAYSVPGFYYQDFITDATRGIDWIYPTGNYSWKVRFSPHMEGDWQYKLRVTDKGGTIETQPATFTVTASSNKGFLKVSPQDARYFEFDDGAYFPGIGYNLGLNQLKTESNLQTLEDNGIQFLRVWFAPSAVFATSWSHWRTFPEHYNGYLPRMPIVQKSFNGEPERFYYYVRLGSTWYEPCMAAGHEQPAAAIKPNTTYQVKVRYHATGITGSLDGVSPSGLVIKTGGWLDHSTDQTKRCYWPGTGTKLAGPYGNSPTNPPGFIEEITTTWNSGNNTKLPMFYAVLENATAGFVYIEEISIREMIGGTPGIFEVLDKPDPNQHLYYTQRKSYQIDQIIENIKNHNLYIRPVLHEKNEDIFLILNAYGVPTGPGSVNNFYGSRTLTAPRWLQQAWWRYAQARWGYSPNIHSWELINEGDPFHGGHYKLTDELGKSMHCRVFGVDIGYNDAEKCTYDHPNDHMASTSFWHSFPASQFWKNTNFPNVDYADVHAYISTSYAPVAEKSLMENDAAYYHLWHSNNLGTRNLGKPVIRGEAGMDRHQQQNSNILGLQRDTQGVWLHNYLWSSLDAGGLIEQYWWISEHVAGNFDHDLNPSTPKIPVDNRFLYKIFSDFASSIPLSNGSYQDLAATASDPNLRVVGQKDLTHHSAHMWLQNKQHTWKNVVDGVAISPISATVSIGGFQPSGDYLARWWDPYQRDATLQPVRTESITALSDGTLVLSVNNLASDTAVKVSAAGSSCLGDVTQDKTRDLTDVIRCIRYLVGLDTLTGAELTAADANQDGSVDLLDAIRIIRDLLGLEPLPACQ